MDYNNYSLGYDCSGDSINYIWLISRKSELEKEVEESVNDLINSNFDTFHMKKINQHESLCGPRLDITSLNTMWNNDRVDVYTDTLSFNFQLEFKITKGFDFPTSNFDTKLKLSFDITKNKTWNNTPLNRGDSNFGF